MAIAELQTLSSSSFIEKSDLDVRMDYVLNGFYWGNVELNISGCTESKVSFDISNEVNKGLRSFASALEVEFSHNLSGYTRKDKPNFELLDGKLGIALVTNYCDKDRYGVGWDDSTILTSSLEDLVMDELKDLYDCAGDDIKSPTDKHIEDSFRDRADLMAGKFEALAKKVRRRAEKIIREADAMSDLEKENQRLKELVSDLNLDIEAITYKLQDLEAKVERCASFIDNVLLGEPDGQGVRDDKGIIRAVAPYYFLDVRYWKGQIQMAKKALEDG